MIKRIVSFALYQPLFIVLGMILFVGAGAIAFNRLPVEAFPDVTDTQVTVISLYPGRAAEEVEAKFGNVHLLVNNAGVGVPALISTVSWQDWEWALDVNVSGVLTACGPSCRGCSRTARAGTSW